MTEKLYYIDSHLMEFEATVTECRPLDNGYAVILDSTAFFPEGGGQSADTGYIGGVRVTDVQEIGGEILHYCVNPLTAGTVQSCRLDREQRLRRMQNHSGEHIVSGLAHGLYGCENVGFHMGEGEMTVDFDRELSWDELMEIEKRANEVVRSDKFIMTWFPGADELTQLTYRSKLELSENVRIVEIDGVDRCACCAPHVTRTGEVGIIKILDAERHRGGVRISLACGMDALDDYRLRQRSVTEVSRLLSAKRGEIAPAVSRLLCEQEKAKERIALLSTELISLRAESCAETDGNICLFDELLDEIAQRELVNLLMPKCRGLAAVFCGSDAEGYRYVIGSQNIDLRKNARKINGLISGRGGGRPEMISGRASSRADDIRNALNTAKF